MTKQAKLTLCLLLALTLILGGLAACGGKSAAMKDEEVYYKTTPAATWAYEEASASYYKSDSGKANSYQGNSYQEYEATEPVQGTEASENTSFVRKTSDKLVYTCRIQMETLTFEQTVDAIRGLIAKYEGFIETEEQSDSSYGWYYADYRKTSASLTEYIVVRIPTENYDAFLGDLSGNGKITSKSQNVENITTVYNDTVTTISSLKAQEKRLLEMMGEAKSIEEMLAIEDRLTDVQTELAIYESRLSGYDLDVAYSTITINVREVLEYTPTTDPVRVSTFGDRLKNTLNDSWKNFTSFLEDLLFFLIRFLPIFIVVGGLIALVVWLIVHSSRKAKARRTATRPVAVFPSDNAKTTEITNTPEDKT